MARLRVAVAWAALVLPAGAARALDVAEAPFDTSSWRSSGVYSIAQTADGFLWVGTQAGLRRFDGNDFVDIDTSTAPALGDDHCRVLLAKRDGSLWIATGGGGINVTPRQSFDLAPKLGNPGLVRFHGGVYQRWTARDGLANDWVWALEDDGQAGDGVWIGTEGGLSHFHDGVFTNYSTRDGLADNAVFALHRDSRGDLWIGTSAGLSILRGGRLRGGRFEQTPIKRAVIGIASDRKGRLWVSTSDSVIAINGESHREYKTPATPWLVDVDRDDNLWLGTTAGLFRLDETAPESFVRGASGEGRISAVMEDREGSLWLGTQRLGLVQMRVPRVANIGAAEGLGGDAAFAVLAARDGSVWMTTTDGVSRWQANRPTNFRAGVELPEGRWRTLAEGRDGSIWVASQDSGLARYSDGKFRIYSTKDGLPSDGIWSVAVDDQGSLWITWGGQSRVSVFGNGDIGKAPVTLGESDGLCPGALAILQVRGRRVWLGLASPRVQGGAAERVDGSGLTLIENGRARCYTVKDGLPSTFVRAVHEDAEGNVWLRSGGTGLAGGLARFRDGRFAAIPATASFAAMPSSINDDGHGHLWLTTRLGVVRVKKADLHASADGAAGPVDHLVVDATDGMRAQESTVGYTPAATWDRRGRLWVATQAGVSIIRPPEEGAPARGDAIIDKVLIDGVVQDPKRRIRLPAGGGNLDVHFTASSFVAPARLVFQHRLDGLDRSWVVAGTRRATRYSHLGPGDYVFRVRVLDSLGRATGAQAALPVEVPPFLHQRWWFLLACVAAAGAALAALHRLKLRRLQAGYAALQAERARIARDLHDNLAQGFAAIELHLGSLDQLAKSDPPAVRALIEQTRRVVDLAKTEARGAIWDIREQGLDTAALETIMTDVVAHVPRSPETDVRLTYAGPPLLPSGILKHELVHIVQEAIVNSVRHAKPTRIGVDVRHEGDGLRVSVKDDGRGMANGAESTGAGNGIGVVGMRERALRIGGTLAIANPDDAGTEVVLFIPQEKLAKLSRTSAA